ncbi:hypothetical protein P3T16_000512 [Paraburkholderia sp. GAS42]
MDGAAPKKERSLYAPQSDNPPTGPPIHSHFVHTCTPESRAAWLPGGPRVTLTPGVDDDPFQDMQLAVQEMLGARNHHNG